MGIYLERDPGPSKLDEKIDSLRGPDGNVWLHPKDASALLFPGLFAFYKGQMAEMEELGFPRISVNVEALAKIASIDSETHWVNLADVVREIAEKRQQAQNQQRDMSKVGGIISSRKPPKREF